MKRHFKTLGIMAGTAILGFFSVVQTAKAQSTTVGLSKSTPDSYESMKAAYDEQVSKMSPEDWKMLHEVIKSNQQVLAKKADLKTEKTALEDKEEELLANKMDTKFLKKVSKWQEKHPGKALPTKWNEKIQQMVLAQKFDYYNGVSMRVLPPALSRTP